MNILDASFKYVSAAKTDIRRTIKREQKRLAAERLAKEKSEREAEEAQRLVDQEAARVVTAIKGKRG